MIDFEKQFKHFNWSKYTWGWAWPKAFTLWTKGSSNVETSWI